MSRRATDRRLSSGARGGKPPVGGAGRALPGDANNPAAVPVSNPDGSGDANLQNRELLVCVTGGIAAYKTAYLVSLLVQRGAGVSVAMTRNATKFVGRVTFEALTGRQVQVNPWRATEPGEISHLKLSEAAELCVVAPATADCIGKLAGGIADDLVSSLLLGAACPVLIAPAMNERMWRHPAVQRNVEFLGANGYELIGPDDGWQACRAVGPGRMSEPAAIFERIVARLTKK